METILWGAMFYIVMIIGVIVLVKGIVSRFSQNTNHKIEALEAKVKKLEDEIKNIT